MFSRRHLVALGLGASLLAAMVTAAGAKDRHVASVLGADIVLSIPQGYCALDRNNPVDEETITTLEQVNAGRNTVLLMFADCKQLERLRTTGQSLSNSGVYLAPASARSPVKMSRSQFVREIAQVFKQRDLVEKWSEEGTRRVNAQDAGVEVERNVNLGLLHSDDTAVYTGVVQTLHVEGEGKAQIATVGGLTLVRRRVVSVNLSAPYSGKATVKSLLSTQRDLVKALLAAN